MNNRVTITFSKDFVAGDSMGFYYSDPSTQTSGFWKFEWVNGTAGTFEVQVDSATTTTGETEAIRFASAWTNSLNGFTVTQPVSGNDNQVQITSQTYHFVNVLAKYANTGSTMAIPDDYNYALSTVITGNKITYEHKESLNIPTADNKYLWRSDNANEVKTKHNLNDDRIGALENDKANLEGGNDFTGNQTIDGVITVENSTDSVIGSATLNNFGLECSRDPSYIRPISNDDKSLLLGKSDANWSLVSVFASKLDILGNVVIGTSPTTDPPTEKLEVDGNALVKGNIYERFVVTEINPDPNNNDEFDLSDEHRVLRFSKSASGTLVIPTGLSNKVWEIFVATGDPTVNLTIEANTSVILSYIKNGRVFNDPEIISSDYSAKLIRTGDNIYTLIRY